MTESFEKKARHESTGDDLAGGDEKLDSPAPGSDSSEPAQEAADLDQDPDEVPNRIQEPEPPRTEYVEASDPPAADDDLYDETED